MRLMGPMRGLLQYIGPKAPQNVVFWAWRRPCRSRSTAKRTNSGPLGVYLVRFEIKKGLRRALDVLRDARSGLGEALEPLHQVREGLQEALEGLHRVQEGQDDHAAALS